jgi:FMN-dependent NADH-azoreductase
MTCIPHLDDNALIALNNNTDNTGQSTCKLSDDLISEIKNADMIVCGSPMLNFSISSSLKSYFDHVIRVGKTVGYNEKGSYGMLQDKPVVVMTTSGGIHEDTPRDFQRPLLKQLLNFVGLKNVAFIGAHGLALGDTSKNTALAKAEKDIEGYVDKLPNNSFSSTVSAENYNKNEYDPKEQKLTLGPNSSYLEFTANLFKKVKNASYQALGLVQSQKPTKDILDIGCGVGVDTLAISELVTDKSKVVGIDLEEKAIEIANSRAKQSNKSNVVHYKQNIVDLTLKNQFDCVRAERVFQHLSQPGAVLDNMVAATKPGGQVVVIDTDWESLTTKSLSDNENKEVADFFSKRLPNGAIAKNIATLFGKSGLTNVTEQRVKTALDYEAYNQIVLPGKLFSNCFPKSDDHKKALEAIEKNKTSADFGSIESVVVSGTKPISKM